ncbi:Transposable element Tc3 transposase [Anthophora quadrimaculata]
MFSGSNLLAVARSRQVYLLFIYKNCGIKFKMGRGKQLDKSEIDQILLLRSQNKTITKIEKLLNRSRHVVYNFLKSPKIYGKRKSTGRPPATTERDRRAILHVASNCKGTARKIAEEAGVSANVRTVRRILQRSKHIQRKKLKAKPPLSEQHKEARLKFARDHVWWRKKWRNVIFSDEKKFNLDGPDGWNYYFHDLRKEEQYLSRRQMGGGNVMVWAGIGYHDKTDINFLSGRVNSEKYIKLIDDQLSKHATRIAGCTFIFQQDNAAIHTARCVKAYFNSKHVTCLEWPARSPDLNIIENIWAELSRKVYEDGKQYKNVMELKQSIVTNWSLLRQKHIKKLFKSIPNPLLDVIQRKGGFTKY